MKNSLSIPLYILLLINLNSEAQVLSPILTDREYKLYSSKGFLLSLHTIDNEKGIKIVQNMFVEKGNCFLRRLNKKSYPLYGHAYYDNIQKFNNKIDNHIKYMVPRILTNFRLPYDSIYLISNSFWGQIQTSSFDKDSVYKTGVYYRIEKVRLKGFLIEFKNFDEYLKYEGRYSSDKNGKRKLGNQYFDVYPLNDNFEDPYIVLVLGEVKYHSDHFLPKSNTSIVDYFYNHLYIGKKRIKKISLRRKQLRELLELDEIEDDETE